MILPARWTKLKAHEGQDAICSSRKRFRSCWAARRSGKSERLGKRETVKELLGDHRDLYPSPRYVVSAPTRDQAKEIYWEDIRALIPTSLVRKISDSELKIWTLHGPTIQVMGMDKPQRLDGPPLDYIVLDEYGDMKATAWTQSVRPALSTEGRYGRAVFIGKPKGRNHWYELAIKCQEDPEYAEDWSWATWWTETVVDPKEVAKARRDTDELSFRQEYQAEFLSFEGRAYYAFDREVHASEEAERLCQYDPTLPLHLRLDFNVAPGTATIVQHLLPLPQHSVKNLNPLGFRAVLDEIFIPANSNTPRVLKEFVSRYKDHKSEIWLHGDPTGGNRHTSAVAGSDWDIVNMFLVRVFGDRVENHVMPNPRGPKGTAERARINAINHSFLAPDGTVSALVKPSTTKRSMMDFEGVTCKPDGSLDKLNAPMLTHLSDGFGYGEMADFPCRDLDFEDSAL